MESNKNDTNGLIYKTETHSHLEIKLMDTKGEIWGEVINWEIGINIVLYSSLVTDESDIVMIDTSIRLLLTTEHLKEKL